MNRCSNMWTPRLNSQRVVFLFIIQSLKSHFPLGDPMPKDHVDFVWLHEVDCLM